MTRTIAPRARRPLTLVALGAAAALTLGACTASHSTDRATGAATPAASASPTPTPSASLLPASDAAAAIMATPDALPVLGRAHGTIDVLDKKSPVVAEVLQVRATPSNTHVVWRLKSATTSKVDTFSFQFASAPLADTRLLGIVDPTTRTTYRPYTYAPAKGNGNDNACTCSDLPAGVDENGEILDAVVPPLPASVTTVNVTMPGFATITHVPVDRAGE